MSFDPSEYDLSELRTGTGNGDGDADDRRRDGGPDDRAPERDQRAAGRRDDRAPRRDDRAPGRDGGARGRGDARGQRGRRRRERDGRPGGQGGRATGSLAPDEIVAENRFEEILERERSAAPEARERPYLTRVPHAPLGVETTFEWLDYLLRRAGRRRTRQAFDYYQGLGWLSEGATEELNTYLDGLNPPAGEPDELDVDDHRASLLYVTRLAVMAASEDARS